MPNVIEAIQMNLDAVRAQSASLPQRDRLTAPLTEEQLPAYMSVRRLLDRDFARYLDQSATPAEMVETAAYRGVTPKVTELMRSEDALQLFRKVVQDMLVEPDEPSLIFTSVFPTVRAEGIGTVIEIILTDAIEAQMVNEGQPLGDANLDFEKARQEIRVVSFGVQIGLTKNMLELNQWDLLGMHVRAAANALARRKEQYGFGFVQNAAYVVFDNDTPTNSFKGATTGVNQAGTSNYTLSHLDFVDLIAGLVNHQKIPTDIFYHPLAWSGLMKDPMVNGIVNGPKQYNMPIPQPGVPAQPLPFALNAHMVPWINSNVSTKAPSDAFKTDMLVVDRSKSAVLIQKSDPEPTEWVDPATDIFRRKWIESYGVGITHGGTGIAVAKNIVADANYAPYPLIKTL